MKNSKKIIVVVLSLMLVIAISPIQSEAAAKINIKRKTLTVGQSATLKIKGTKKKAKWSSSNKKVATVSSKGKVKARKAGTATITAKIAKKKYTCKITVKAKNITKGDIPKKDNDSSNNSGNSDNNGDNFNKEDNFSADEALKNISYEVLDTGKGVVAILKNNNDVTVSIDAKMVYYNNGAMIGTTGGMDNYAFEPGTECALGFIGPTDNDFNYVDYNDYKLSMSIEKGSDSLITGAKKISVNAQVGADNITAEFVNNSGKSLEFIYAVCIFYDKNKKAIDWEGKYINCKTPGSADYATFDFPYDDNFDTVRPDSYEIYINHAYDYDWNQ